MKTSNIIITFATILVFAHISRACSQNNLFVSASNTAEISPVMIASEMNSMNDEKNPKAKNTITVENAVPIVNEDLRFEYLRFDVNKYMNENTDESYTELPDDNMDYLRFDVNYFTEQNPVDMNELPVNEFDYLRFNVNDFYKTAQSEDEIGELPSEE